jgi:hypothetical protein
MESKCNLKDCNNQLNKNNVSYVHKWREYGGYSEGIYPRYFCSEKCLTKFEKNSKCNFCGIVAYQHRDYIKGTDGYTYCNDNEEITVGNTTCYNQVLHMDYINK